MADQFRFPQVKPLQLNKHADVTASVKPVRTSSRPSTISSTRSSSLTYISDKPRHHSRGSSLSTALLSAVDGVITRPERTTGLTEEEQAQFNTRGSKFDIDSPWDFKDEDDKLHAQSPAMSSKITRNTCTPFTVKGWINLLVIIFLGLVLLGVFLVFPVVDYFEELRKSAIIAKEAYAWNMGGVNGTGQVPVIPNFPQLIDKDTPDSVKTRIGQDGKTYNLVFSDEFEVDGRTFWPGDDPFWEAVDLHYWGTGDFEWYDPEGATTENGSLVLTLEQMPIHGLDYRSGMIQSWNKVCFTGGIIEVSASLPGDPTVSGFWPGAWTMGNLGRAGYGATNDGTWSYSYDACDVGAMPNQTYVNGTGPDAALYAQGGTRPRALSYQPGQKLSACTCPGEDHPGPSVNVGRGAPEIDIFEGLIMGTANGATGGVSQSAQFAPFDPQYVYDQTEPASTIYNDTETVWNGYKGGHYQEACSAISYTNNNAYELTRGQFAPYGFEITPGDGPDAHLTFMVNSKPTWTMTPATVPPRADTEISQRLIPVEPLYVILNFGFSSSFANVRWTELTFPAKMRIDYVRIWQEEGQENLSCDPPNYPTAQYIQNHLAAYLNPNATVWEQAGYTKPRQSYEAGGCPS